VAFALAGYFANWGDRETAAKFRLLAMTICEEIGMINSLIYSRSLFGLACSMEATAENMAMLNIKLREVLIYFFVNFFF
jgi:hypothetical protein